MSSKPPKPGPDLYVATARIYEKSGDKDSAAGQYQKALQIDPSNLPALLGYAQLHDSQREYSEADKLYQEA
ncbi:MAG TPA: tetratricopeptide repeat protein, partial [Pirellulales bacterium]|nr:tetratricopeptide repeat protein [Pirellulales bacterium]